MKLKRIRKLQVNSRIFKVNWHHKIRGGSFNYKTNTLNISTIDSEEEIFEILCHELWEIVAVEMYVRHQRIDCYDDFIFVYDHRQHTTMTNMFSGLLLQFIK